MSDNNPAVEAGPEAIGPEAVENENPVTGPAPISTAEVPAAEVPAAGAQPAPSGTGEEAKPAPATTRPNQAAPAADDGARARRKVREGLVVSSGMEKTAVVVVIERVRHPRYAKTVQRTKRLYAHDETNDVRVGDRVRLVETRPLSKLKRWRVESVLERAR
jgi:small subunit ribosomal protein S17